MKTNRTHKIILITLLALLLAAGGYFIYAKNNSDKISPTEAEVRQRQQTEAKDKKQFIEDDSVDDAEPAPVPTSSDAITIRSERTAADELTVFTQLKGYASGSCELTVTNSTKTHSQNVEIIYQPEYSVCAGFSVPVSKLGNGSWIISLAVTGPDGSVQTKQITTEVK